MGGRGGGGDEDQRVMTIQPAGHGKVMHGDVRSRAWCRTRLFATASSYLR